MKTKSKTEMLAQILAHTTATDEIEFLNKEIALLNKQKARRSSSLTDTQKENLQTMNQIVCWMETLSNQSATVADIRKHFGLTAQKVVPMMNKLTSDGTVTFTIEKKVKVYTLAEH